MYFFVKQPKCYTSVLDPSLDVISNECSLSSDWRVSCVDPMHVLDGNSEGN
jgi:hypothetical protein